MSFGYCSFRVYPIKNEDKTWFIPSFSIPISFTNKGAQLGKIENVRLRVTFPKLPIANHYEFFDAKWIVNSQNLTKHRFEWIEKNVSEIWMPMILLPKETKTRHIVFESIRWEEPVIQEEMLCTLEIKSESEKVYKEFDSWKYKLDSRMWVELVEEGRGFMTQSENSIEKEDSYIFPEDLHKYTGTKDKIENKGKKHSPSYLNYGSNKKEE